MKKEINLLPAAMRSRRIGNQGLYILLSIVLVTVPALLGWLYGKQAGGAGALTASSLGAEVEMLQQETRRLEAEYRALDKLKPRGSDYSSVLKAIEDSLPSGAWITELEMSSDGEVLFRGFCGSWDLLGTLEDQMTSCQEFREVDLKSAARDLSWSLPTIKFTIVAKISE